MYLPDFKFHQPSSVSDALSILTSMDSAVVMAGGTDLLVEMKKGLRRHEDVVSLSKVQELKQVTADNENVYIGACTTHNEIILSPIVNKYLPVLRDAASKIGSEQVRNMGTVGGNICTAASCCDSAPVLLAMNASAEVVSREGIKLIPLKDFFVFNKRTVMTKGDILARIIVPKPAAGTGASYEKFGLREAGSIAVVSVAAMVRIEGSMVEDACIVIGAVAPTPKISEHATAVLTAKKIDDLLKDGVLLDEAGDAAVKDSIPIDDIRGGAQYRRDVLKVLTVRAVKRALENAMKR